MTHDAEQHDRYAAGLARLFDLGLELAEHLQARALAAEEPEVANRLAAGFHRIARSVRQTAALAGKLKADRARLEREDVAAQAASRARAVEERKAQIRRPLHRLGWTEAEGEDYEELIFDIERRIDVVADTESFFGETIEAHIHRICRELDLPAEKLAGAAAPPEAADAMAVIAALGRRPHPPDAASP